MPGSQLAGKRGLAHWANSPLILPIFLPTNARSQPLTWCLRRFWAALSPTHPQAETSYCPPPLKRTTAEELPYLSLLYLPCFALSQAADSRLWIQAGSNAQPKSHILVIKYFRCFPSLLQAASKQQNEDRTALGTSKVQTLQFHASNSVISEWAGGRNSALILLNKSQLSPSIHLVSTFCLAASGQKWLVFLPSSPSGRSTREAPLASVSSSDTAYVVASVLLKWYPYTPYLLSPRDLKKCF